ncbi:MAG: glycosyltransferase family 2 protein [FCB group bacterium]|jgi:undecaprenyl-phosphate 4-deoxy-4-formamido-L-arabinose transferase|nr:glycosyltransferase family 2 protein [FCB group bacterium]
MPDLVQNNSATPGLMTILIPCFNEQDNVDPLYGRLTKALQDYGRPFELLFVDDGSTDATFERLRALYQRDPGIRILRFARNFGQQMAFIAGFDHARGDIIVTIDADMQTAPEDIPLLVNKLAEGYDVVYGKRQKRKDPAWRIAGSWMMSGLLARITGIKTPDSASSFLALDGAFVRNVNRFRDKSCVLVGRLAWLSYGRSTSVAVSHAPRHTGETKYGFAKCVSMTLDFICNYSLMPLRAILYLGALVTALGAAMVLATVLTALLSEISGLWVLASALVFCAGVQLLATGILAEYLGRTFHEVKDHPLYVIREILEPTDR